MDILYLLEGGSHYHDDELRYSLRSIAKYGKNVGRIFIAGGHMPEWIDQTKVTWVKCGRPYDRKHKNLVYAIIYACQHSDISEEFLLSSDDHYYLKHVDFNNYPYFIKNEELPQSYVGNGYRRSLYETRQLLVRNGLQSKNYAQHCNTHFVKSVLLDNLELAEESYRTVKGVEPTCLMLNLLQEVRPFNPIYRKDIKWDSANFNIEEVDKADCISSSSRDCDDIMDYLAERFPEPSPYEKQYSCIVTIPIYKEIFEGNEVVSIDQGFRILQRWPISFFAPESLNTSYYEERYPTATIVRFPDHFFNTIKDYSRLCYSSTFYEAYKEYDYMQIYQPDCWIFRDEIEKYSQMGYDYIGAPWPPMPGIPCEGVGNGGFCLRRVSKFIELCHIINDNGQHPEDRFWCLDMGKHLKLAPLDVAADYSLEHKPKRFNGKYGHRATPMGCHKPWRFEYSSFWKVRGVPEYVF